VAVVKVHQDKTIKEVIAALVVPVELYLLL
jgi:hypothetical protein